MIVFSTVTIHVLEPLNVELVYDVTFVILVSCTRLLHTPCAKYDTPPESSSSGYL